MSFVIQGEINIDADGAVRGVSVSKKQLAELGGAASKAEANLNRVGKETAGVGRTSQVATGNVGNLAAQFNDIGVMMAAGQSPFQLAIQQGSQITQVLGPMGTRGAVTALSSALKSMINPISLITYASIAGGAALVSWAFSAGEAEDKAKQLEAAIAALEDVDVIMVGLGNAITTNLTDKIQEARDRFGNFFADMLAAEMDSFKEGLDAGLSDVIGTFDDEAAALSLGVGIAVSQEDLDAFNQKVASVQGIIDGIGGTTLDEVTQTYQGAYDTLVDMLGPSHVVVEQMRQLAEQTGIWERINSDAKDDTAEAARLERDRLNAFVERMRASIQDQERGQEMLATLQQQNNLQRLIISYGEDSAQVTSARAAAERAVFEETLATLDVSEGLKEELRAAFEAGQDLADVDMVSGISAAAAAAYDLAQNLNISLNEAMTIMNLSAQVGSTPGRGDAMMEWQRRNDDTAGIVNQANLPAIPLGEWQRPASGGGGSSRAGGRSDAAREAERERQAVEDLVQSLQQELDLSRAQDPVLREMIGYREDLRAATDDERAAIENLIRTRLEEEATLERQREGWDFWGNAALTALSDVDGALEMVLKSLQQAALLGTGPLGALFGGTDNSGKGGLFGMVIDAIIPSKADGGPILGIGGGREDRQLTWTSPGEYIINARSASQNRMLLDQINYGAPAYADGGVVGGGRSRASGGGFSGGGSPTINVYVQGAVGDRDLEERARQGTARALAEYDADVLPMRMREISNAPERIG